MKLKLKIVESIYAAFGSGDIPAILACLDPEVAWEAWPDNFGQRSGVPWLLARSGRAGAQEFFGSLQALEFHEFEVRALLEGPHAVVADVRLVASVRATGLRFEEEELHYWTFGANGLVTRFRHYADTAKHIAAAGLWPSKAPASSRG
jgi:uncharacterized protein